MEILVTINGVVFDLAKGTYHDTCMSLYRIHDMSLHQFRVLKTLGEVTLTDGTRVTVSEE